MPSTPSERPSLVRRVALVGAAAAAIGGALAAAVSGAVAARLVAAHEDETVLAIVDDLADEIVEELAEDDVDDDEGIEFDAQGRPILASVLAHELHDVKRPQAAAAILGLHDGLLAGDSTLPRVPSGQCVTTGHASAARRACAVALPEGRRVVLSVSAADERERLGLVAWALLVGALVGAAVGGVLSHRSAAWAMAPVTDLRDRVGAIDPAAPDSADLRGPVRHAEVEALRAAVEALVDRLGVSLAHAQAFSAQAAHELRTPLSLLAGELELILERATSAPEDLADLERLHRIVGELVALTQRLLILAGPGRLPGEQGEPVDLSDIIGVVVDGLPASRASRLTVDAAEDVVVRGDFELLRSMVHNAVENALKFSASAIEISVHARADDAVLEVRDHGPGIAPADRERVFAPFVRVQRAGAGPLPGHGIGLALIAHVAEGHGGRAEFVDTQDGACLQVRLPRWRSRSVTLEDEASADVERPAVESTRSVGSHPELEPRV